jgi:hypothetical protein
MAQKAAQTGRIERVADGTVVPGRRIGSSWTARARR